MVDYIIALMENNHLIIIKFKGSFHPFCSTQLLNNHFYHILFLTMDSDSQNKHETLEDI